MKNKLNALALASLLCLGACGGGGDSTPPPPPAPKPISVVTANLTAPALALNYTGQALTFKAGASSSLNNSISTYVWDFGDGSDKGNGISVSHTYSKSGTFTVTVSATDSSGSSGNASATVNILAPADNKLTQACLGGNCAVLNETAMNGSGVGIWQYNNTGTTEQSLDVNISGLSSATKATLVFTNGGTVSAPSLPAYPAPASAAQLSEVHANHIADNDLNNANNADRVHNQILQENQALAASLRKDRAVAATVAQVVADVPATPAIGTQRVWNDTFNNTTTSYTLTAADTCKLSSGRNAVFWTDAAASSDKAVTPDELLNMKNVFCANDGKGTAGFDLLTGLLGDAWGSNPYSELIQDGNNLLDINLVFIDSSVPGLGGYFASRNNFVKSKVASSNEALAFFLNVRSMKRNMNFMKSALLHEATHMVNFFQRAVKNGVRHDTWLEETTAMMTEDILSVRVFSGNNQMLGRLANFLNAGGTVSYINWPQLSGPNYAIGGSFGAFINRRYGVGMHKQISIDCADGVTDDTTKKTSTSYDCLNDLIKKNGGISLSDELIKFGTTALASWAIDKTVPGYGYPAVNGDFPLAAIDVQTLATKYQPATALAYKTDFSATSHTYANYPIASGAGSFVKKGITVPAGTTVTVVIQ